MNGDVLYNSSDAIGGFQFNVDGATVNGASGGDAAAAGFTVSAGGSTVLGFSFTGSSIPPGCGTLTQLSLNGNATGLSGQPSIDVEAIVVNSGIVTVTTFDGNLSGDVDAPAFDTNPAGVVVTGVCTATTFKGDGAGLSGVGGENDITSCLFI